ncbi:MAG: 3-oxoadipate enol-lactonase [Bellilinea sp.]|nr:MAG: 3-oxoadipate enol-lactonase [Bellilinea sp.]
MHIIDEGPRDGFPVLLLHGLGANAESWCLQIPALAAAGYRVLAPDLPGFGKSRFEGDQWSLDWVINEFNNLFKSRQIEKVGLLGISMGGVIGLKLAAEFSDRVEMSVFVNTFAVLRPRRWGELRYFMRRGLRAFFLSPQAQADLVASRIFPQKDKIFFRKMLADSIKQADPKVYRQAMLALIRFDGRNLAKRISHPVLIVSGKEDTTVPLYMQRRLVELLPNCGHVIIEGAGHALPIDQPEVFNRILIMFFQNPSETIRTYCSKSFSGCLHEKF